MLAFPFSPTLSRSLRLCLWHCMPRGTSTRAANLLPILASCCIHPTQVNLSLLLPPAQFYLLFLLAGRVSKLPNFFFCFWGFFHFSSFCLLLLTRWRLSTYYLVKGVRLQLEIVMAKRETAAATTTTAAASEKWKKWKSPMRKNAKKYLLVGYPATPLPCTHVTPPPPCHPACLLRKQ